MTTLDDTVQELDAGLFVQKSLEALRLSALSAIQHRKKSTVTMVLELEPIGDSASVTVKHTLKYSKPTRNGKASEENTTTTPMYVGKEGFLTVSPELQDDLFKAGKNIVTNIRGNKEGV
jgi:hypothetical protein